MHAFVRLTLLVLVCRIHTFAALGTTKRTENSDEDGLVALIVDQLVDRDFEEKQELSGDSFKGSVSLVFSPQCWRSAIALILNAQKKQDDWFQNGPPDSASTLCASLPEAHQKRLALEIANCHVQDFGKALYQNTIIQDICTSPSEVSADTVQLCLQQLTEAGEHAYTHFITYLQVLCTRQTQELVLLLQEQVKDRIASSYATISEQSMEHMDTINRLSQRHVEQMQLVTEIPSIVQNQVTVELQDYWKKLKDTLPDIVREHDKELVDEVVKRHAKEYASHFANFMDQLQQRDVEIKDRYDEFATYQSSMLLQQAREMERQRKVLEDQRTKMQTLSDTVSETTLHMQPLVGLQSMLQLASEGYTWITFLLHFLVTFNIVWLVSRPERCNPFRTYLYSLVVGEALIELVLTGALRYGWLSETEQVICITELRRWAIAMQCISYTVGFVATFFATKPVVAVPEVSLSRLDIERLLDERVQSQTGEMHPVTRNNTDNYPDATMTQWGTDPTAPKRSRPLTRPLGPVPETPYRNASSNNRATPPYHDAPRLLEKMPFHRQSTESGDVHAASRFPSASRHRSYQPAHDPNIYRHDPVRNVFYPCDIPVGLSRSYGTRASVEQRYNEPLGRSSHNEATMQFHGIVSPDAASIHPANGQSDAHELYEASLVQPAFSEMLQVDDDTNVNDADETLAMGPETLRKRSAEAAPTDEPASKRTA